MFAAEVGGALADAQKKAFFDPFTKETGIKIQVVEEGVSVGGKLAAMQRSGNIEWDIIGDYLSGLKIFYDKGLLEDIDFSIVTHTQGLVPGAIQSWAVGHYVIGTCMAYNTNVFSATNHPMGLLDFFDVEKYPGPRSMANWGGPFDNLALALLYDGVPRDQVFPIDFDRAFKVLDKVKPHVKVWFSSGNQLMQALDVEEVVIAAAPDGRYHAAKKGGAPIQNVWKDGYYFISGRAVVKGSPMKDAAMQYLNFCLRPENQAIFTNEIGYTGVNTQSLKYVKEALQKELLIHPDNVKHVFDMMEVKNAYWAIDHADEVTERWNTWLAQ